MNARRILLAVAIVVAVVSAGSAVQAGVSFGIGINVPVYHHPHYYPYPYRVYVSPGPVYVRPLRFTYASPHLRSGSGLRPAGGTVHPLFDLSGAGARDDSSDAGGPAEHHRSADDRDGAYSAAGERWYQPVVLASRPGMR